MAIHFDNTILNLQIVYYATREHNAVLLSGDKLTVRDYRYCQELSFHLRKQKRCSVVTQYFSSQLHKNASMVYSYFRQCLCEGPGTKPLVRVQGTKSLAKSFPPPSPRIKKHS